MTAPGTIRCTRCAAEFDVAQMRNRSSCPACGTSSVPCATKDDVDVRMNWHELRILVQWAEQWERRCGLNAAGTVAAIARRLARHRPPGAPPLRFAEEFAEFQDRYPSAELLDDTGEVIVPRRTLH